MTSSIRLRLTLATIITLSIAMAVFGVLLIEIFTAHLERQARANLDNELTRLIALVEPDAPQPLLTQDMPDPRYAIPLSGLYWQVSDPETGQIAASRSLFDQALDIPAALQPGAPPIALKLEDAGGTILLATTRRLGFERADGSTRTLDLVVAERRDRLELAIAAFRFDLFRVLAILVVMLAVAGWIQVSVGLRPFSGLRQRLAGVREGRERRLVGRFPREVKPLVDEVNELLDAQGHAITYARARASDLAHGLQTPLTVLGVEARKLRQAGLDEPALRIEKLVETMAITVHHQLGLARLRHRARAEHCATPLAATIEKVIATLRLTPDGESLHWTRTLDTALTVDLDPADLTEMCGIVLENASQWAKSEIRIEALHKGDYIHLIVEDDGPGFAPDTAHRPRPNGGTGYGLGLRIVSEIAEINGASITRGASQSGGARVEIALRAAYPGTASPPPPR
ncbi:ATP-binding protein [Pelagibacterium luteolum]|uniref:histidine kinase n=1 Tax=Pelagibacterium luteolum TaxID=440168 RepID=A0A1G7S0W0_9HYPH|nr:HAMP domain-containing sensor histidine kinase [Pelagibacterium luteolum]SDG16584.1 Signal transduction histidine kinase [Pelagibacterium luteolum]